MSVNSSGSSLEAAEYDFWKYISKFMLIILASGLLLNVSSIVSLCHQIWCSKRLTIPVTIMACLIWCDFIALICHAFKPASRRLLQSQGLFDFCTAFGVINILFPLLSGLFAMFMACERYCAFAMPFRYRRCFTPRTTLFSSISLTLFAIVVSFLPILGLGSYQPLVPFDDNVTVCKMFWLPDEPPLHNLQFTIYFSSAVVLITVVVTCNFGLTLELYRARRKIADLTQGQTVSKGHHFKFVWTVMVITLVFLGCWMPWVFVLALVKLGVTSSSWIIIYSFVGLTVNHSIDPLIFLVSRYAKKILSLLTNRNSETSARTTVG